VFIFLSTSFHFLSLFSDLLAIFHPHLSLLPCILIGYLLLGAFSFSLYRLSALPVLNRITAPPPLSLLLAATHLRRNNIFYLLKIRTYKTQCIAVPPLPHPSRLTWMWVMLSLQSQIPIPIPMVTRRCAVCFPVTSLNMLDSCSKRRLSLMLPSCTTCEETEKNHMLSNATFKGKAQE
jgi:hypothetical protein